MTRSQVAFGSANGMSALGHKRTFCNAKSMSALPQKADMCSAQAHVRLVPKADIRGRITQLLRLLGRVVHAARLSRDVSLI